MEIIKNFLTEHWLMILIFISVISLVIFSPNYRGFEETGILRIFLIVVIVLIDILWLWIGKWFLIGIGILIIILVLIFLAWKFRPRPFSIQWNISLRWKKVLWWILGSILALGLIIGCILWWQSYRNTPRIVEGGTEPACKTDPNLIIEELRIGKNILDTGISYHYHHDKTGSFSSVDFKTIPGCTDTLSIRGREHEVNATSCMEFTFNSIGDPVVIYENHMGKGGNYYLTVHKPIIIDVVKN